MTSCPNKFERFIVVVLIALAFMVLGAALDIICRLVQAGWQAADFLINLFFTNP